jgi:hypothetical protein
MKNKAPSVVNYSNPPRENTKKRYTSLKRFAFFMIVITLLKFADKDNLQEGGYALITAILVAIASIMVMIIKPYRKA